MFELRNSTQYLILFYITISLLIYYYKPSIIFNKNKLREFGVGKTKTIFYYPLVIIVIAILLFYLLEIFMLKKNNLL